MLYLGNYQQKPIIFHNFWRVKTQVDQPQTVVGQAAITTLQPGAELLSFDSEKGDYLSQLQSINLLLAPDIVDSCPTNKETE